jgi:hypothetical protein
MCPGESETELDTHSFWPVHEPSLLPMANLDDLFKQLAIASFTEPPMHPCHVVDCVVAIQNIPPCNANRKLLCFVHHQHLTHLLNTRL